MPRPRTKLKAGAAPLPDRPERPLLLSADQAAHLSGVSRRAWWSLHAAGKTPLPIRLGRRTLWRTAELDAWITAGCPARDRVRR